MSKREDSANQKISLYGLDWHPLQSPLKREMIMVQKGGSWKGTEGQTIGNGLEFHFKVALKLLWPEIVWHKWVDTFLENFLTKRTVCVIGPAASGKTFMAAFSVLLDWYCFPGKTTVVCCSTTREDLENRVWGEIKRLHKSAKSRFEWLPGHLIESRQRIIYDEKNESVDGRDFRNGLQGVACRPGGTYVGLGSFAGIHNKRVTLLADEASLMPKVFVEAISNMDKCPKFLCVALGNPKDTTDALGILAEPAANYGGWDGGIDQEPVSKVWNTRRPQGVTVQLVGSDSPNLDGHLGAALLTQEQIDRDIAFYGKDSLQYTMMNQGMMPRGQGSRRVLTRQECERHGAKDMPFWASPSRTRGAALDAAYGGVGGDRCILNFFEYGEEIESAEARPEKLVELLVNQPEIKSKKRHIFAMKETVLVPIKNDLKNPPSDQIAIFCKEECEKRGIPPANFIFDSGMRTALVQALSRLWSVNVQSIDSMGKPTNRPVSDGRDIACDAYYKNFVTEMWWSVRLVVLGGQMKNMSNGAIDDFSSREWGIVGKNLTQVEPKTDMKKKIGRSPDEGDCLAYAVELARRKGFIIRQLKPVNEPKKDDRWKSRMREKSDSFWNAGRMPVTRLTLLAVLSRLIH